MCERRNTEGRRAQGDEVMTNPHPYRLFKDPFPSVSLVKTAEEVRHVFNYRSPAGSQHKGLEKQPV